MKAEAISREVDELIWHVAESGDAQMEADFLQRYPQHSAHLNARKNLVGSFRSAKPVSPIATHFEPNRVAARPRYWLAPLAAGLLIGLAIASYQVVKFTQSDRSGPATTIIVTPQSPVPTPRDGSEMNSVPTGDSRYEAGTGPRPDSPESDEALVVIKADGASLFSAIAAIKDKGVKVEIMPGLEDAPISLEPNRDDGTLALEPLTMLKAVRIAAGFELVDAGPDGYLALPRDKTTIVGGKDARPVETGSGGN